MAFRATATYTCPACGHAEPQEPIPDEFVRAHVEGLYRQIEILEEFIKRMREEAKRTDALRSGAYAHLVQEVDVLRKQLAAKEKS